MKYIVNDELELFWSENCHQILIRSISEFGVETRRIIYVTYMAKTYNSKKITI